MALADTPITVRRPTFELGDLPRHWLAGSALATAFGNAGHVFIPIGEEFFIDSVRSHRDRVTDADLARDVAAFIGQEAVHRRTHESLWAHLRSQGVPVDPYARWVRGIRAFERILPTPLRLATTAALEHYTAAFGSAFLTEDLARAVPEEMARLLAWHGWEELEHRSVAFDVLELVDDRYLVRLGGFVLGTTMLTVVPLVGTVWFRLADGEDADDRGSPGTAELAGMVGRFVRHMGRHVAAYLRPGFHPRDLDVPTDAAPPIA